MRIIDAVEMMSGCGFSIHDVSRVELSRDFGLPRFNMALELGLALALRHFQAGILNTRQLLIMDPVEHQYDRMLSVGPSENKLNCVSALNTPVVAGLDPAIHDDRPRKCHATTPWMPGSRPGMAASA